MTKSYCDVCGTELTATTAYKRSELGRIRGHADGDISIEIMTGYRSTMNDGDFCDACIFRAIRQLESEGPRPTIGTAPAEEPAT